MTSIYKMHLVDRMFSAMWKLRRLQSAEAFQHYARSEELRDLIQSEEARLMLKWTNQYGPPG